MISNLPSKGCASVAELARHYQDRFLRCAMRQLDAIFDAFEAGCDDPEQPVRLRASDVQLFSRVQRLLAEREEGELLVLDTRKPTSPAIDTPKQAPTAKAQPGPASEAEPEAVTPAVALKQSKLNAMRHMVPTAVVPAAPSQRPVTRAEADVVKPAPNRAVRRAMQRAARKIARQTTG